MKKLIAEDLKRIKHNEEQAAKGPWVVRERVMNEFFTERSITTSWVDPKLQWPAPIVATTQVEDKIGTWIEQENAAFIAQSREDIPDLLNTLNVFGQAVVYQALLQYYKGNTHSSEEQEQLEAALNTCWEIIKSNRARE